MLPVLYGYLVGVGLVALGLVALATLRAATGQTAGRLLATLFTLAGIVLAAVGRVTNSTPLIVLGVVGVDVGLTLYVLYLPDNGLLQLATRRRRKDPGGGQ